MRTGTATHLFLFLLVSSAPPFLVLARLGAQLSLLRPMRSLLLLLLLLHVERHRLLEWDVRALVDLDVCHLADVATVARTDRRLNPGQRLARFSRVIRWELFLLRFTISVVLHRMCHQSTVRSGSGLEPHQQLSLHWLSM